MKSKSTFVITTSLAVLAMTIAIYAANRVQTASANTTPTITAQTEDIPVTEFEFGGIRIGRGQTASIIAILKPDQSVREQLPVQVEFEFHDWEGNTLANETKTLVPGQASSFDVKPGIIIPGKGLLIPCLKVFDPDGTVAPRLTATLEVWDTETGKAQLALYCRKAGDKPVEF